MSLGLQDLQERIRDAAAGKLALCLRGGGSKEFYGNESRGEVLDTRDYRGVVSYEPSELVISARCGTPLAELEATLTQHGQCFAFEPPHFGPHATLGGCVAAGLSGPRRASAGALRDFVLGVTLIDGRGRALRFGGQVMKNVAGYDVARLVAGSLGTLGLIAEVSLKVLPMPACEVTLQLETTESGALEHLNLWAGQPLPVTASAWHRGELRVRLSGAEAGVRAAARRIGGEPIEPGEFWRAVREQTHPFFAGGDALWRVALPSTAAPLAARSETFIEWNGAQRWLRGDAEGVRELARAAGGHATLFRATEKHEPVFAPLEPVVLRLHRSLKDAFDPGRILNPGRMYAEL